MDLFSARDFKVFEIPEFQARMEKLAAQIRPKLAAIGDDLAPKVASLVDQPIFVHVARHARRTVNPPDDTWAALGTDKRGYKKDVHFKVAVSRNCVRLLLEVGPEYDDKGEWAMEWAREPSVVREALGGSRKLAWFKDEHDEEPALHVSALSPSEIQDLGRELTRRRDGQLVLGRRIDRKEFLGLNASAFRRVALATFKPLALLFTLHAPRSKTAV